MRSLLDTSCSNSIFRLLRGLVWLVSLFGITSLACALAIYAITSEIRDLSTQFSSLTSSSVPETPYYPEARPRK